MSLILPPIRPLAQKAWVKKDDIGNVVGHGVSHEPVGYDARDVTTYETVAACKADNTVIDQAEAIVTAHELFFTNWESHDLTRVYANKSAYAKDYRNSMGVTVSSLLANEASIRGISVEALVTMIESQAFADAALEAQELVRIAEKISMP